MFFLLLLFLCNYSSYCVIMCLLYNINKKKNIYINNNVKICFLAIYESRNSSQFMKNVEYVGNYTCWVQDANSKLCPTLSSRTTSRDSSLSPERGPLDRGHT